MKIFLKNTTIQIIRDDGEVVFINPDDAKLYTKRDTFWIDDGITPTNKTAEVWQNIQNENGDSYASFDEVLEALTGIVNFKSGGGGAKVVSGTVTDYSTLPTPVVDYAGQLWYVDEGSGGLFSILGIYKYPKGLYTPNALNVWELVPINVKVSEDSLTLVNITNWAEWDAFAFDISVGDRLIFNAIVYENLTGIQTSTAPNLDTTNWKIAPEIQHITSDGTSHSFINQDVTIGSSPTFDGLNITGVAADTVEQQHIKARTVSGTIAKGSPVYITDYNIAGWYIVAEADASNPVKMPAVGIADVELNNSSTNKVVTGGKSGNQNTNSYNQNDPLYVASGGGLTATKPAGTNLIQKMGYVARKNVVNGVIQVVGAGRSNDLPNISNASRLLGRGSANGAGFPEEIIMSGLRMIGTNLTKILSLSDIIGFNLNYVSATSVQLETGKCCDSTGLWNIDLAVADTLTFASDLDTGSEASSTWYYIHVIADSTGVETTKGLISLSRTAPTLPTGYDIFRWVGVLRNNALSDIVNLRCIDIGGSLKHYEFEVESTSDDAFIVSGFDTTTATGVNVDISNFCPPQTRLFTLRANLYMGGDGNSIYFRHPDASITSAVRRLSSPVSGKTLRLTTEIPTDGTYIKANTTSTGDSVSMYAVSFKLNLNI